MEELTPVRCGCGGEARTELSGEPFAPWIVKCPICGTRTELQDSEAEAVEAWNRAMGSTEKSSTVERTAKVVHKSDTYVVTPPKSTTTSYETITNLWEECGNCHAMGMYHGWNYCPKCGARLEWE